MLRRRPDALTLFLARLRREAHLLEAVASPFQRVSLRREALVLLRLLLLPLPRLVLRAILLLLLLLNRTTR